MLWVMYLMLLPFGHALAGDTPFLVFDCVFSRLSTEQKFSVEFVDEEGPGISHWESSLKMHHVKFERQTKNAVKITVRTGLPGASYLLPQEYTFTSPLSEDRIEFSIAQKDPIKIDRELVSLVCQKAAGPNW